MPFPVLAGMPVLAGLIGGLFSSLFSWLVQFVTRRVAIVLAVIAVIATVTTAFFAAIEGLMVALSVVLPSQLVLAASLVVPSNASACFAAILSAHLLRWVYSWQVRILQYKLL